MSLHKGDTSQYAMFSESELSGSPTVRPTTPAQRRLRVAELLAQGVTSNAALAMELGVRKATIERDRAALKSATPITAAQATLIGEHLAAGRSIADVAGEVGCSPSEIRARFPEYRPTKYTREEKIALLDEFEWLVGGGVWPETAADRVGMKLPAVCQWYRRLGLTMPPKVSNIARGRDSA